MDTDKDRASRVLKNGINGACRYTVTAVDTEFLFDNDPTTVTLGKSSSGAGIGTRCGVTGEAMGCSKTGGQPAGRLNPDSCRIPGYPLVHQARARQ